DSVDFAIDSGDWQPMTYNSTTDYWEASWDTTAVADSPYTVSAQATDTAGQTESNSVDVTVNNAIPVVAIVNPPGGADVSNTVTIEIDATDASTPVGELTVEYAIDGGPWQATGYNASSGQYEANWDTTTVANGTRTLDARATADDGDIGTAAQISVNVSNGATGDPNGMYVWDISWGQRYKGKNGSRLDLKVPVNIKRDSNANGQAESTDLAVKRASVALVLTWAGSDSIFGTGDDSASTYIGSTNGEGKVTFTQQNASEGLYRAEVTGVTHAEHVWTPALDNDNPDFFDTTSGAAPAIVNAGGPPQTQLRQNNPNPFNPETWIPFALAEDVNVSIQIYNVRGQRVRTLDLGYRSAGYYVDRSKAAYWDGRNDAGERIASGMYLYRLTAGDYSAMRRMLILK
ncbi:MAG: Ig-like domain-containing protein, partial [Candidatus Poribacteria bacterium]|nr:Ig-like domain-containing protein [Candidatus Poribacteria bacterium]